MAPLDRHYKTLMARAIVSVALFAVFVGLGVAGVFSGRSDILFWLPIVIIASIVALPRRTTPDIELDDETITHLRRVQNWFAWVRLTYLLVALFILFGLPELIS